MFHRLEYIYYIYNIVYNTFEHPVLLFGHSLLSKEFYKVVVVLFAVWAVTALVLLEVPNLCFRSFLSRRTCTAAFCGATHLDMKPWPA